MIQKSPNHKSYEKCIVINDLHIPFEDKKAVKLILKFLQWFRPERVIINGDLLDCQTVGRFVNDPFSEISMIEEIERGREFLRNLRSIVGRQCHIDYIFGN